MTRQPEWELIDNLGDQGDPIAYGGFWVYRDTTGVYEEEAEYWEPLDDTPKGFAYRFSLERCGLHEGHLVHKRILDKHPDLPYPLDRYTKWFDDHIDAVADFQGLQPDELRASFCSEDPIARAWAYRSLGEYFGFFELDQYPLELTIEEAQERYGDEDQQAGSED